MKLAQETYDRTTVIRLAGEITSDDTDALMSMVRECLGSDARDFVLDLSATEFLDSAALETLLWVQEQADERLGQVRLSGASESIRKILEMTRLDKHFNCHGDVDTAMKSLR